ncbi:MAG: hypothetical protein LBD03_03435 [Methanobrevibacter sp.]|nr:hypothetical protein [Candidatus Methanovirga procula]
MLNSQYTLAQKTHNPERNMPISILTSILICSILYITVSLVLTGIVNYNAQLNVQHHFQ